VESVERAAEADAGSARLLVEIAEAQAELGTLRKQGDELKDEALWRYLGSEPPSLAEEQEAVPPSDLTSSEMTVNTLFATPEPWHEASPRRLTFSFSPRSRRIDADSTQADSTQETLPGELAAGEVESAEITMRFDVASSSAGEEEDMRHRKFKPSERQWDDCFPEFLSLMTVEPKDLDRTVAMVSSDDVQELNAHIRDVNGQLDQLSITETTDPPSGIADVETTMLPEAVSSAIQEKQEIDTARSTPRAFDAMLDLYMPAARPTEEKQEKQVDAKPVTAFDAMLAEWKKAGARTPKEVNNERTALESMIAEWKKDVGKEPRSTGTETSMSSTVTAAPLSPAAPFSPLAAPRSLTPTPFQFSASSTQRPPFGSAFARAASEPRFGWPASVSADSSATSTPRLQLKLPEKVDRKKLLATLAKARAEFTTSA